MRLLSIILLGEKSLAQLREATAPSIQNMKIDLIFVSPLTRALQTCLGIFEQAALAQVKYALSLSYCGSIFPRE